jgi:N-acetylmuramoyl-L-alanine amidase
VLCIIFSGCILLGWPNIGWAMGEITVNTNTLNVRSGPGLDQDVIGQINKSEKYKVLEEKNSWYKILMSDSKEGWVASWLVQFQQQSGSIKQVEALANPLNVRYGPGTSYQVVTQIHPEQTFPWLKEEGDWTQIQLNENDKGWVATWLVKQKDGDSAAVSQVRQVATVQASILNVRAEPDTSSSILGKLSNGEKIEVLEIKQGWYKISFEGKEGWVAGDFVAQAGPSDSPEAPSAQAKKPTERIVKVSTPVLNVRSSSSLDASIVSKLRQGDTVEVIEQKGDWLKISMKEKEGWIASWLVKEVNQQVSNQPKITILNQGTNLRKGPGTNFATVSRANQGETYNVIATEGDWFQILLSDGTKAYVAGWIVSAEGVSNVERQTIHQHLKNKKIVIDPGHGGKDHGATGSHFKTLEKVVNLQVSNILKSKFEASGANVILTRTSDRFITLQQRIDFGITEKADLFLSIHHNTNSDSRINGTITYFYSDGADRKLANSVQKEVIKNNGFKDLKARKGNFFVLRENPLPSILIELGFLTNYNDEFAILQTKVQEGSANGILQGVALYFKGSE